MEQAAKVVISVIKLNPMLVMAELQQVYSPVNYGEVLEVRVGTNTTLGGGIGFSTTTGNGSGGRGGGYSGVFKNGTPIIVAGGGGGSVSGGPPAIGGLPGNCTGGGNRYNGSCGLSGGAVAPYTDFGCQLHPCNGEPYIGGNTKGGALSGAYRSPFLAGGGGAGYISELTTDIPLPPQNLEGWYPGKAVINAGIINTIPDYIPGVAVGGKAASNPTGDGTWGGDGLVIIRFIPPGIIWDQNPED